MQKSNASEKSKGILAFAVNTDTTDYVGIAQRTMSLASRVLDIPYTIVTEDRIADHIIKSNRYDVDQRSFVEWKNMGRHMAYDLTPYDETLVLDIDYIVQDQSLLKYFNLDWDYMLTRHAIPVNMEYQTNIMGAMSLPFVWATVFMFRKTDKSRMFFDLINRIQKNYHYYRDLFNIESRTFRNDYAFSIADIILNGFSIQKPSLPLLLNIMQSIDTITISNGKLVVKDNEKAYVLPRMNMHVLSKRYLDSANFNQLLKDLNESA